MQNQDVLETIYEVPINEIKVSEDNVRLSDANKDLEELATSIKKHGLLQPVVLLGEYGQPPYELISGQRRFLAHKQILRRQKIRAVFAGKLSKIQAKIRSLAENMQRRELEYIDTAKAVTFLYQKLGKDERKVSQETGLSLRKVRDLIAIEARATPTIKAWLNQKKVSPTDVKRAIRAAQENLRKAEELLSLIIKVQPTVHQKRRIVKYGQRDKKASAREILEQAMKPHLEQNLIITLPDEIRKALENATKNLAMEPDEIAERALTDWLRNQGFFE